MLNKKFNFELSRKGGFGGKSNFYGVTITQNYIYFTSKFMSTNFSALGRFVHVLTDKDNYALKIINTNDASLGRKINNKPGGTIVSARVPLPFGKYKCTEEGRENNNYFWLFIQDK